MRTILNDLFGSGTWGTGGNLVASALLTVEGELDDITGLGQTEAAHALCSAIPAERRHHFVAAGVGHVGIFSGRRWREEIYPKVRDHIRGA